MKPETIINKANKDNPGVIAPPPFILLMCLGVGLGINYLAPLPYMKGPIRIILGTIFLAYAVLVAGLACYYMYRAGTNIDVRKPATTIVTNGVYAYTRNPIYLSMALILASLSLLLNSLWVIILMPLFILVMNKGVITREESYLESKFGSLYLEYKNRVRRWI